jgi:hypothetical protein
MNVRPLLTATAAVVAALAGCAREEAPTIAATTAAEGVECVNRAAEAYQVGLEYINLGPIEEDRTGAFTFAIPGTAARAAGQTTTFLCRLDANRTLVDIVTFQGAS